MDSKHKLENISIFHNPCSVFGRKHSKLTTKRGKVTDYAVNFTAVALTPTCIDDIYIADLALGRFLCLAGIWEGRPLVARHLCFRVPRRMSSVQNYILQ